jgi:hypothetical protein
MFHMDVVIVVSDVAYIAMVIHLCCKFVQNVLSILDTCCKCFIWMLHILQLLYSKCVF